MKSSTLPLTSPCSGTKRKTTVPLFFASTGGLRLLSFIPILLLSLLLIDFYSPSLHRFRQVSAGSVYSLSYLHCFSRFILLISTVLPAADVQVTRDQITPLAGLYCFCRFILLISTVLPFAGFLQVSVSLDCSSFIPILLHSLQLIDFYNPSLHCFRQVSAGQITPLTVPYCFSRLTLLISGYKVAMLLSVFV